MFTDQQPAETVTGSLSASALGFCLPTPLEPRQGPISGPEQALSDEVLAENLAELIRQKALVNVDLLSEILTKRAVEPTASANLVRDALEANVKLSGITAKQQAKEFANGPAFSINITIPGRDTKSVTVEGVATPVDE